MKKELFEYQHYKPYLSDWVSSQPHRGHGVRSSIAKALNCQVAYISQILNGGANLNLEQGEALCRFLGHTQEERHFFLLLLQKDRAGTRQLSQYFEEQIASALEKRLILRERLNVKKTLRIEDQAVYYSSWVYAAVHVALSIPEFRTKEALSQRFDLPLAEIARVLEFLCSAGLATQLGGRYQIGAARIHLGDDSPLISKHHANWRIKAIEAMDRDSRTDLHYSSVVTVSRADILKLKSLLVGWISEAKELIRESKEEEILCFSVDLFQLR